MSVTRSALLIEDYTPAALWTDEPFAFSRIAKPERPTANGAAGKERTVAGTASGFASGEGLPYRAFLLR